MSPADDPRLQSKAGSHHQDGRPYHFQGVSQEDRIRKVFGLAEDAPLLRVSDQALTAYYDYLVTNLLLPFDALYCPTGTDIRQLIHYVRVTELLHPLQGSQHNLYGLFCRAMNAKQVLDLPLSELGVRDDNPNCQLIDDYAYWFVNCR